MNKSKIYISAVMKEIERLIAIRYPGHKTTRERILKYALRNYMERLEEVIRTDSNRPQ